MGSVAAESETAGLARTGRWAARPRASAGELAGQAAGLIVLLGAIGLGMALTPSPTGAGTHCQLGLRPCGMLETTGLPCPTCGVTTAFCLAAHGRPAEALVTQPFGLAVFVLAAAGAAGLALTLAMRRSILPLVTPWRVVGGAMALMLLLLASWTYKLATV